jgi:hypothetical protein
MAGEAMSTLKLMSFGAYKVTGIPGTKEATIEPVFGFAAARFDAEGKIELLAGSAPYHAASFKNKEPRAGAGLLMLYGNRDALEESQYWRTEARRLDSIFAAVEYEIEVGNIEVGLTDRALLQATNGQNRFLNVRRAKKSLQNEILEKFAEYVDGEGGDSDKTMSTVAHIATRPDLCDRLLEEDKELSKLDVFVIPVADDLASKLKIRQVAILRPGATVVSEVQSGTDTQIVLPSWMSKDEAELKRGIKQRVKGMDAVITTFTKSGTAKSVAKTRRKHMDL